MEIFILLGLIAVLGAIWHEIRLWWTWWKQLDFDQSGDE